MSCLNICLHMYMWVGDDVYYRKCESKEQMDKTELKRLANSLYGYSICAAIIIEIGSLLFIGWNPKFTYGLALGTCIAIVNYNLLILSSKAILEKKRGMSLGFIGYLVRLTIYGGVFLMSYRVGIVSGIATLFGYFTIKLGIFYLYGFKPGFASRKYEKKNLNDLDSDQWAEEKAEKEAEPSITREIRNIFGSDSADINR